MKTRNQSFTSRLPVAADEPNLSGAGAFAARPEGRVIRVAGLIGALCLGLMVGLVFNSSGVRVLAAVLIGVGGALMAAACVLAERK